MTSGVYLIKQISSQKVYVGSSKNIEKRFIIHRHRLNAGVHENHYLQRTWAKYGSNDFSFDIALEVEAIKELLLDAEQKLIDYYSGHSFNLRKRAESNLGLKHTEEARKNMSAAQRRSPNKKLSQAAKDRISAANTGRIQSVEERAKRSKTLKGRKTSSGMLGNKHSAETLKKMSESRHARNAKFGISKVSDETKLKMSLAHKGKIKSPEHLKHIAEALKRNPPRGMLGKKHSPETIAKMSATHRKRAKERAAQLGQTK